MNFPRAAWMATARRIVILGSVEHLERSLRRPQCHEICKIDATGRGAAASNVSPLGTFDRPNLSRVPSGAGHAKMRTFP
jgi:hypothetical protein